MVLKKQTLQPGPCVPGSSAGWVVGAGSAKAAPAHHPPLQQGTAPCSAWSREGGCGGDPGVVLVPVGLNTSVPSSVPCEIGTVTSQRCSGVVKGHQSHGLSVGCSGLGRGRVLEVGEAKQLPCSACLCVVNCSVQLWMFLWSRGKKEHSDF